MGFNKEDAAMRRRKNPLGPVLGFVLFGCSLAISYVLSEPVRRFLERQTGADLSGDEMRIVIGFAIFIIMVMLSGLLYTVMIPRKKSIVKDLDLVKERKAIDKEREARKARRRQVKKQLRDL
jgi:hypothetical protein